MCVDANMVVHLLNSLEKRGFAVRERDPQDRRRHVVRITPAGTRALVKAEARARALDRRRARRRWAPTSAASCARCWPRRSATAPPRPSPPSSAPRASRRMAPRPFRIEVPDAVLDDLRERLARTRWPEPLNAGAGWDDGADVAYLRELCAYWADGYDWRAWEARLNAVPRLPRRGRRRRPALLARPRRGPVADAAPARPRLAGVDRRVPRPHRPADRPRAPTAATRPTPSTSSCPSLPGFGFGGAPRERGWGVSRIAGRVRRAHDARARLRALRRPGRRLGRHGRREARRRAPRARRRHPRELRDARRRRASPDREDARRSSGCRTGARQEAALHAAAGHEARLAHRRADRLARGAGRLDRREVPAAGATATATSSGAFSKDVLLTNLMTLLGDGQHGERGAHLPRERRRPARAPAPRRASRCRSPTRRSRARSSARRGAGSSAHYNVVRWTDMPRGGHFAALEEPELLLDDVRAFFRTLR